MLLAVGYRHPRESGDPEPAPDFNRGRPLERLLHWIPAFAGMTNK